MHREDHWEHVYQSKAPDQVSWFQTEAQLSRRLIASIAPARNTSIVDIGAGASVLVDELLDDGYTELTVLDISPSALALARERLGSRSAGVRWIASDVLSAELPAQTYDTWHDRAVFHFLTDSTDRRRYVELVLHAVRPGGTVIVATFAEDGPTRCSGLDVARYSPAQLHAAFGKPFELLESHHEMHITPSGTRQAFTYCVCRVNASSIDGAQ